MSLTHWLLIAVAGSVLAGSVIIAGALDRNSPRYSTTESGDGQIVKFDRVTGAFTVCRSKIERGHVAGFDC